MIVDLYVDLARLWWPVVWSNISPDVAVKGIFRYDYYLPVDLPSVKLMGFLQAVEDLAKNDRGPPKMNTFCHLTTPPPPTLPRMPWETGLQHRCWNWQPASLLSRFWTCPPSCSLLLYTLPTPPPSSVYFSGESWLIHISDQWLQKFSHLKQQKYFVLLNASALMSLQGCNQGIHWHFSLLSRASLGGGSVSTFIHLVIGKIQFLTVCWTECSISSSAVTWGPPSGPCHVGPSWGSLQHRSWLP